ncbi:deoxyribonuclease-1 [Fundulus heteroclitus]|uniref:deoxyribonuclease-1 n=1 Tax=Fundulus heteroclitus TaxID=8078 RepID=UPI00165AC389|nr:deoxyribonuclease-1 [Fundulus heteroclitus]
MKVAAFNVKKLGLRKVKNETVSDYLIKILSQYSVVVLLEVMDESGKAMNLLLKKLNSAAGRNYKMICSSSLGRSAYKEKFACFYRKDEVTLIKHYQYEDNQPGDEDAFDREPFMLRFHCPNTTVGDLVLIPVHTRPRDAFKELDELYDVVTSIKKKWKTTNIMILGDFNAAGPYLSKKKKEKIRINSPPFYWLIDDTADTTTSNSNKHTYDRIVVYGKKMVNAIVPNSAMPFNFQRKFRLTKKVALSISDHYPVEVTLKTISATSSDSEASDSEASDSEASDSEASDSEASDSEASDSEASDSEAPDSEAPDSEAADSEAPDSEAYDSEAPDSEASNSEASDSEASDSEVSDSEVSDSEAFD